MSARTRSARQRTDNVPPVASGTSATTSKIKPRSTRGRPTAPTVDLKSPRARSRSTHAAVQRKATRSPAVSSRKPPNTRREQLSPKTSSSRVAPFLIFLAILTALLWGVRTHSDDLCRNNAVKAASSALSRISTIDVCESTASDGAYSKGLPKNRVGKTIRGQKTKAGLNNGNMANGDQAEPVSQTSPGLAVIRETKDLGNQFNDLIELEHDNNLYNKVVRHLFEISGDLYVEYAQSEEEPEDGSRKSGYAVMRETAEAVHEDLDNFLTDFQLHFESDVSNCVSFGVTGLSGLRWDFSLVVMKADEHSSWPNWVPNIFKSTEQWARLRESLVRETAELGPLLDNVYERSRELVDRLSRIDAQLRSIIRELHEWDKLTSEECDHWVKKLGLSKPTSLETTPNGHPFGLKHLHRFTYKDAYSYWDEESNRMANRCLISPLEHIQIVNEKVTTLTLLQQHLTTTGERALAMRKALEHVRDIAMKDVRHGIPFSDKDRELAHKELPEMVAGFDFISDKWLDRLTGSMPRMREGDQTMIRVGTL